MHQRKTKNFIGKFFSQLAFTSCVAQWNTKDSHKRSCLISICRCARSADIALPIAEQKSDWGAYSWHISCYRPFHNKEQNKIEKIISWIVLINFGNFSAVIHIHILHKNWQNWHLSAFCRYFAIGQISVLFGKHFGTRKKEKEDFFSSKSAKKIKF